MKNKRLFTFITAIIMIFSVCTALPVKISVPLETNATDVSNLKPEDSTYIFIKSVEGCDLNCFWDVAQWTIGYGNKCPYTHTSNGTYWHQNGGHSISESEARSLFNNKLSGYVNILKSNCSGLSMTQNQFDALLSATYNHGNVLPNGCKSCGYKKHPLVQYLLGNLTESQAREQYYVWCINAGTKDEKGLRNRRKKEADLFFSDTPDPNPPIYSNLTSNKTMIAVGEEITFTASSDYATGFTIGIDNETSRYVTQEMPNGQLTLTFNTAGIYTAYVTSYNSYGYSDSAVLKFFVSVPCDFGDEKLVYINQTCSNLYMTADTNDFTGTHNVYGTEKNFQPSQIWKLKKQPDGSYRLLNMGNNQCMEVFGGAAANGTNISTYDETIGFENQKFNFYYINGHYFISPVCTPCLVDMNPDGSHDVATYDYGDDWSSHQTFDITEVPKFIYDNINRDFSLCDFGDEKLVYINQTCSNLYMTADTGDFTGTHNVYGTEKNFQSSQIWKLKKQTDGSYRLLNMGNNQCMEVFGGAAANGTNISTYDETASFENQKFNFYYINGHYFISPVCTPCLVDMNPDGSHDVATYDYGDDWSSHQTFDITEVPKFISDNINRDFSLCDFGNEKLVYISQTCSNLFMTADTGEFNGTHNVYGTEKNFQPSQIWKLKKQTDGSYRLLNMGNNQCMEVFGGVAANGTNISTYDETASFENQKFNFYYINGHYFISPVCTPCLVDMNPDGSHDVATYDYGDDWSSHQTFDITEVPKFIYDNINRDFSLCDFGDEKLVYISQTSSNLFMTADTGEFNGTHNVYGTEKNFQSSQIWKLKKQTDNSYRLLNMGNNQCMEVFGGAAANGTNISTYDETASFENQKFNFYYINGHYFISPVCTPCLVDMNPDGSHDVATYDYGDDWSSHQTFDITEVPEFISGDINCDLSVSVADAVLLQKWLLGVPNTELINWKAADLCEDGRLDVFDMIEMRKLIINSLSAQ